jgi:5-methylcytosine-specific restriction endonuclease McrA
MSLPYYKRFPRDFLEGTIGLSFEVKGAYAIVLDLIYMRDGRLPDDARFIAGQLGCSVRKWTTIREELIARGKLQVHEGIISFGDAEKWAREARKTDGRDSLSAAVRAFVLERDGYRCAYCQSADGPLEVDHVFPVARGGGDDLENLTCACRACNRSKGAKLLSEWVAA